MLYPAIAAGVSLVFAAMVWRQYQVKRRPCQRWWAISLFVSFIASAAYLVALAGSPTAFRIYYLGGALLTAPFMGLGSAYLGMSPKVARWSEAAVGVLAVLGTFGLLTAPLDAAALAALDGGSGVGVLDLPGWTLAILIVLNTYGTAAVVGVALWSAVNLARRRAVGQFFFANLLIATGVLFFAAAGTAARAMGSPGFWGMMALGWIIAYGGFLLTYRLPVPVVAPAPGPKTEGAAP